MPLLMGLTLRSEPVENRARRARSYVLAYKQAPCSALAPVRGPCRCPRCANLRAHRQSARLTPETLHTLTHSRTGQGRSFFTDGTESAASRLAFLRQTRDRVIRDVRHYRAAQGSDPTSFAPAWFATAGAVPPANGTVRLPDGRRMYVADVLAAGDGWKAALISSGSRSPKTQDNHVGVEIEFGVPRGDDDDEALKIALVKAKLAGRAALGSDGSVSIPGRYSYELRLIAPETQIAAVVDAACGALAKCGATVNATCGLHVHLDARNRDPIEMHARLYRALPWLYSLVSPSRRRNQYCRRNRAATPDRDERYLAINATSERRHGTIEVRLHQGTVDAIKIKHWILLLRRIVDTPAPPQRRPLKDLHSFAAYYRLPMSTTLYMAQRMRRFAQYEAEGLTLPEIDVALPVVVAEDSETRVA